MSTRARAVWPHPRTHRVTHIMACLAHERASQITCVLINAWMHAQHVCDGHSFQLCVSANVWHACVAVVSRAFAKRCIEHERAKACKHANAYVGSRDASFTMQTFKR